MFNSSIIHDSIIQVIRMIGEQNIILTNEIIKNRDIIESIKQDKEKHLELKDIHKNTLDSLNNRIKSKDKEIVILQTEKEQLSYNVFTLSKANDSLSKAILIKEEKIKRLQSKCKTAGMMIDDLQSEKEKQSKLIEELTSKIEQLQFVITTKDEELKRKYEDVVNEIEDKYKQKLNIQIETVGILSQKLTKADIKLERLKKLFAGNKEITEKDYEYLEELRSEYPGARYIARDYNGKLFIYHTKPYKRANDEWRTTDNINRQLNECKLLFIKWEDKEPFELK